MGEVLVFGDLHISDKYCGKHRNYFENCVSVLTTMTEIISKRKPYAVVLAGDLVGVSTDDRTVRDRGTLMYLWKVISTWNELVNGNLYGVIGNHDRGGKHTEADFFAYMGLIKYQNYFDHNNLRVHLVHYGDESRSLDIDPASECNVVVGHNAFLIEGQTTWFKVREGMLLSEMKNFKGVDIVLSGHIHYPSSVINETSIDDAPIGLFYMGCPTRPRKEPMMWDRVYYPTLVVSDDLSVNTEVSINLNEIVLSPLESLFVSTYDDDMTDFDSMLDNPSIDIDGLAEILSELSKYALPGLEDYKSQLRRLAGVDTEAANLAIKFLEEAESVLK